MTREESIALFEQIKENRSKLDGCARHRFEIGEPPYAMGQKVACTNCGGSLGLVEIAAYTRGYAAAGGDPGDVAPGWHKP